MNTIDLKDRVAIVTGGARGIGLSVAQRMLRSGAAVCLWDMDDERLKAARAELSAFREVEIVAVDITKEEQVRDALRITLEHFPKVDILVNNAGITGGNGLTWELEPAVWRRVVEVNLIGSYLVSRAVVPVMLEHAYGRVVNVASVAGKEGNPNASHYSASKAGLIGLTKALGKELATRNILVNCVTPAAARTELFEQMSPEHINYMLSKIPMGRLVDTQEVAEMICWLSSEDCSFATGAVFDISGGRATY